MKALLSKDEVLPVTEHLDWHPSYRFGKDRGERFMNLVTMEVKRMFENSCNDIPNTHTGGLWAVELMDINPDDVNGYYPGSELARGGQFTLHVLCRQFERQYWATPTSWKMGPDAEECRTASWNTCWGVEIERVGFFGTETKDEPDVEPVEAQWTNVPWWSPSYMQVAAALFTLIADDIRKVAEVYAVPDFAKKFIHANNVHTVIQGVADEYYQADETRRAVSAMRRGGMGEDEIEAFIKAVKEDR